MLVRMSSVAEIVEAVAQLSPEQKVELLRKLDGVLFEAEDQSQFGRAQDYLSPEFTSRLIEHFHRAKRAALRQL